MKIEILSPTSAVITRGLLWRKKQAWVEHKYVEGLYSWFYKDTSIEISSVLRANLHRESRRNEKLVEDSQWHAPVALPKAEIISELKR